MNLKEFGQALLDAEAQIQSVWDTRIVETDLGSPADINIEISTEHTTTGRDRPVTAVFDFSDSSGMSAAEVIGLMGPTLRKYGIEQVVVKRLHLEDMEDVR